MKKHLIIAALAAAALVTGCRSYDTDPRDSRNNAATQQDRANVDNSSNRSADYNSNAADEGPGTGGSGAEGGSGSNDVSNDPSMNRGEDLNDNGREPVRQGHRSTDEKDMPPSDGKLQIILK